MVSTTSISYTIPRRAVSSTKVSVHQTQPTRGTIKDNQEHNLDYYKKTYTDWCNACRKRLDRMSLTRTMNSWNEFIKLYNGDRI